MLDTVTASSSSSTATIIVPDPVKDSPATSHALWSELDLAALENVRKTRLIKIICKVEITAGLLACIIAMSSAFIEGKTYYFFLSAFIFLTVTGGFMAIRLCNRGSLHLASWLSVGSILLTTICVDTSESITALPIVAMSCLPLILSIILLSRTESLIVSGICLVFLIGVYLAQVTFNLYQPPAVLNSTLNVTAAWVCATLVVIPCIYGLLQSSFVNQTRALQEQYGRLQDSYRELDRRQRLSEDLSREIAELTSQLENVTAEQASRTHQQVTAVSQVTASLEELNETASQIALSSTASTASSQQTLAVVEQVKNSSQLSYRAAQQGNEAVEKANTNVKEVHGRIDLLGQRLENLTEQTKQVGSIVDIIEGIASETHLLALNASIEAAGASANDYAWLPSEKTNNGSATATHEMPRWVMVQGERFGIIAHEIRNLADRSRKAAKEIQGFIGEMQRAVEAAAKAATESKKDATSALEVSEQVTSSINDLTEVIAHNLSSVEHIWSAAQTVSQSCNEISAATNQQRSANLQILLTMREISNVARLSADELGGLVGTAGRLTGRVGELNQVLDH